MSLGEEPDNSVYFREPLLDLHAPTRVRVCQASQIPGGEFQRYLHVCTAGSPESSCLGDRFEL